MSKANLDKIYVVKKELTIWFYEKKKNSNDTKFTSKLSLPPIFKYLTNLQKAVSYYNSEENLNHRNIVKDFSLIAAMQILEEFPPFNPHNYKYIYRSIKAKGNFTSLLTAWGEINAYPPTDKIIKSSQPAKIQQKFEYTFTISPGILE